MDRWSFLMPLFAFLLYANTFDADFVYDDSRAVLGNPDVLGMSPVSSLAHNDFWGLPLGAPGSHGSYRPLTVLTFRLTAHLAGSGTGTGAASAGGLLHPRLFHVGNALLHAAATSLVSRLALRFLPTRTSALAAAALFAAHPVHCEAVAGVVGRADLLACVLALSAVLLFIWSSDVAQQCQLRNNSGKGHRRLTALRSLLTVGVWVLSVASTLSKETGISALALCAVYQVLLQLRNFRTRRPLKICPLACLVLPLAVLLTGRIWLLGGRIPRFAAADNPTAHCPHVLTRTLTFLHLPVVNLRLLLWPSDLSFDWSMDAVPRITSVRDPRNIGTVATLGGTILLTVDALRKLVRSPVRLRRGPESAVFAVALIVLPLLPTSNLFFYVGFVVAERVLYLPSVGFCFLVTLGAHNWAMAGGAWRRRVATVGFVALVASMTARTLRRNRDWLNEESLYRAGIPVNPPKAYGNLGSVLSSQGRLAEAELAFNMALKYRPNMADVHYNLGNLLLAENRLEEAVWRYQQAIHYRPSLAQAHLQLGRAHLAAGRPALAATTLRHCAALPAGDVRDPVAHKLAAAAALQLLTRVLTSSDKAAAVLEASLTKPQQPDTQSAARLIGHLRHKIDLESEILEKDTIKLRKNSSTQDTRDPTESWIVTSSRRANASLCAAPDFVKLPRFS